MELIRKREMRERVKGRWQSCSSEAIDDMKDHGLFLHCYIMVCQRRQLGGERKLGDKRGYLIFKLNWNAIPWD